MGHGLILYLFESCSLVLLDWICAFDLLLFSLWYYLERTGLVLFI